MTTLTIRQNASEITGTPPQARKGVKHAGTVLGKTGFVSALTTVAKSERIDPEHLTEAAILQLRSTLGLPLKENVNSQGDLIGFHLGKVTDDQLTVISDAIEALCVPSDTATILHGLAMADTAMAGRDGEIYDKEMRASTFLNLLDDYPADVISDAFNSYIKQNRFRPTVSEIREYCHYRARSRFDLRKQVKLELAKRERWI